MPRTAAEIDAAKALLNTTDLAAVTSEVRQFPPSYVTGGKLKLNTNLQVEVAPLAINIAGKDVRITDTTIIGNEHWVANGVETPRVPGSWYYLYLNSAAQFAVSPLAPTYNTLYFAYYHPEVSDLRAIGKFFLGNSGKVSYVQTSLETASAQVLVAASNYKGEDANYYCTGVDDQEMIDAAARYLSEVYSDGGKCFFTEGEFAWGNPNRTYIATEIEKEFNFSKITYEGRGFSTIFRGYGSPFGYFSWQILGTTTSHLEKISIRNIQVYNINLDIQYVDFSTFEYIYVLGSFAALSFIVYKSIVRNIFSDDTSYNVVAIGGEENIISQCIGKGGGKSILGADINPLQITGSHHIVEGNISENCYFQGMRIYADYCVIKGNICINCGLNHNEGISYLTTATIYAGIEVTGTQNSFIGNFSKNNGNLINRSGCETSGTSPMILGEAAPTASNCTWEFTSTGPYEGTGQYRFAKTAAAGTKAYLHLVDNVGAADLHGLIPGTQYEWSGWFKASSSGSAGYQGPRIYQVTTGGGAASATAVTLATASWQWVAVTATIYVNATTAYIDFWASASLGNTHVFDVDNVRLYPPGTTNVHNQNYYNGGTNTYDGL